MNDKTIAPMKARLGTGSINIFGRPFAGKDTQGKFLAELFDGTLLGGGDILRNSTIPTHVTEALHRGELIPSKDYVEIVLPYLSKEEFKDKPLVLSSVGRWKGEEAGVVAALEKADHPLKVVIYLDIDERTVRKRWQALETHDDRGGRYDDSEAVLEKRLLEYREKTLPVIEAYETMGLLVRIDGEQATDQVSQEIVTRLSTLL